MHDTVRLRVFLEGARPIASDSLNNLVDLLIGS
jgi:hypothetical protein